jgi:hypothetical protein
MAEPIKTTIQAAFDHINEWVKSGEKDKAIRGLQEVLIVEPANADAQKMLADLQGSFKLDIELKPTAPVAPVVTAPAPVPMVTTPAPVVPAPMPAPVPAPAPVVVTPTPTPAPTITMTPPTPVAPKPMPVVAPAPVINAPAPAPAPTPAPFKPVTAAPSAPTPTSAPAPKLENRGSQISDNDLNSAPSMLNKVQGLSQNVRWVIFGGVLLAAVLGGYLFYKTFLSTSQPLSTDIQQQMERSSATPSYTDQTPPPVVSSPFTFPTTEALENAISSPNTDVTPSETTEPTTPAETSTTTPTKVKRR